MKSNSIRLPLQQSGFSLVEIMVGLAIGLMASLVIVQVMSVFETQKRSTTGTADAQTNGGIALYNIGRELQQAGYPLTPITNSAIECSALTFNGVADNTNRLSPVTLIEGVATANVSAASDTITIRYGSSPTGGIPTQIISVATPTPVISNLGCQVADATLIVNGSSCFMSSAVAVTGTLTNAMTITLADTTGSAAGVNIACLGSWNQISYAVNNSNLDRDGVPTVEGIVNIQAQYGISATANSNQVTQWVNATNGASGNWAAPSVTERNRIKAIRIAVVARNAKMELNNVTTACSSTTTAAPTGLCAWEGSPASPAPTINLFDNDPNWLRYRYRVFETIIPLRNIIWSKSTL